MQLGKKQATGFAEDTATISGRAHGTIPAETSGAQETGGAQEMGAGEGACPPMAQAPEPERAAAG